MGDRRKLEVGDPSEKDDIGNASGENHIGIVKVKTNSGYNKEKPPEDDCCPICFGEFRVPCRANCGHWFCGSCILRYWEHRSKPWQSRCPFCSYEISSLVAELSIVNKLDDDDAEVLKNIEQYNRFYSKGPEGCLLIFKFYLWNFGPCLFGALIVVINSLAFNWSELIHPLRHPERVGDNFRRKRLMVYFLAILWFFCFGLNQPDHLMLHSASS